MSRNRLYDGLILSTVGLGPSDAELLKVRYPVVILGERIFDGPTDHVAMPNVEAACAATAHLIERGCRRIAIVDGSHTDEVDVSTLRFQGYRGVLQAAKLPYSPDLVANLDVLSMAGGADAVRQLAARGVEFDGVFCVTDTTAIGVLRGLADVGVNVPGQVKVIGFDNVAEAAFTVPVVVVCRSRRAGDREQGGRSAGPPRLPARCRRTRTRSSSRPIRSSPGNPQLPDARPRSGPTIRT